VVAAARAAGRRVEGCLCYAVGPPHQPERWRGLAQQLVEAGCEAIVVRDSGGLLSRQAAAALCAELVAAVPVPVGLSTRGGATAVMASLAGVLAGARQLDVSLSALAGMLLQPSAESVVAAFTGSDSDTGLDLARLAEVEVELRLLVENRLQRLSPERAGSEANSLSYGVPVALIDDLVHELRQHEAERRLGEALAELPRLLPELGHPSLETPVRRMVATQAVLNLLGGDRYQTVTQDLKDYLHGLWGQPPGPVSGEVRRQVLGRDEPLTVRPADLLEPQVEAARERLARLSLEDTDENLLLALTFPDQAPPQPAQAEAEPEAAAAEPGAPVADSEAAAEEEPPAQVTVNEFDVEVEGEVFRVRVTPAGTAVLAAGPATSAPAASAPAAAVAGPGAVTAPMQGLIIKIPVKKGDEVQVGDVVAVLEAMKMQNDIVATSAGKVVDVHVREGEVVTPRQPLVTIR